MQIASLASHEITDGKLTLWVLVVTYLSFATGDGVVVPMVFGTAEGRDESFDLMAKVAELQGAEAIDSDSNDSLFSGN